MNFIKSIFSDGGTGSWSRTASFLALVASIGWVTRIVLKTQAIPQLDGVTLFVTSMYAINQIQNAISSAFANKIGGQPAPTEPKV